MTRSTTSARLQVALEPLELAVWFVLVVSTVHIAFLVPREFLVELVATAGVDMVWITPLSYALLLLPIGLLATLLLLVRPDPIIGRMTRFVLASLSALSVLLLVRQLHPYASVVLALAIGLRLTKVWSDPAAGRRFRRRTAVALAVLLAIGTLAARIGPSLREFLMRRRLPAARVDSPNVLLIVLDAVRAQHLSLYGYGKPTTPALDRWSREGVVFEHAIAPAPWTLPTHSSLFTGVPPTELSAGWARTLDGSRPKLAEVLEQRGYVTAAFSGNNRYGTAEAGLLPGFQKYRSHISAASLLRRTAMPFQTNLWKTITSARTPRAALQAARRFDLHTPFRPSEPFLTATQIREETLEWLSRTAGRPFFVFINLFDAHEMWAPPDRIRRFADRPGDIDRYAASIAYQDSEIEMLLGELRARGLLDRTIVVLTADHGEQFGEHGLQEHGNSLYMTVLHTPLVIRYPPLVPQGTRVDGVVSLVDVPATILELAGAPGALPGRSLADTWRDGATRTLVLSDVERTASEDMIGPALRGPMRSLVDSHWHYIRDGDGAEELYAYRTDPGELINLAKSPAQRAIIVSMRRALARMPPGYEAVHP